MKASLALLAVVAFVATSPATAHEYKAAAIDIDHPWSRPAAAGMNGAGYLTLTNTGETADVLLRVESDAAARVEIHESAMTDGIMRMRKLDKGVAVAPGATVELAPGGKHVMMFKLKAALADGDTVAATLVFKHAGRVDVVFNVMGRQDAHSH